MLIDTHAHLNFEAYDDDRDEVIKRCEERKMAVINVGAQFATSRLAVQLAEDYEVLAAAVGLHPIHIFDEDFKPDDYQHLIDNCSKVVAIGETGLDFFHPTFNRAGAEERSMDEVLAKQKEVFLNQIKLAKKNNLPLIVHGRNGLEGRNVYLEMLEILKAEKVERAVFHCYGGDLKTAQIIIDRGFYIGTDGPLTFKKKAEELQAMIAKLPLEKILIETDCPYLTPEPHRGERNEPVYVEYVAAKIAELKNLTVEEIIERTWQNARELFGL
jgi:TatD DNase family protein